MVRSCEHGKGPSGSEKIEEFLPALSRGSDRIDVQIVYFCFSGSGGRPDYPGGCPVFVGAAFQKASQSQPTEELGVLVPRHEAAQRTVSLLSGEYTFAVGSLDFGLAEMWLLSLQLSVSDVSWDICCSYWDLPSGS